jgi:hypothetical protein
MSSIKHLTIQLIVMFWVALPVLAQADSEGARPSKLEGLLWSLGPVAIIASLVYWLLRSATRGQKVQIDRYHQHMERVEQSLDRIARALERKDTDASS